ncbi:hypothetical protein XHV734_4886 [Xanthomonas hortorum pv. vitians]|nr:hypothetical protein XHV734_4886 [Xanthomonas hortorum pv. vitians]
MQNFTSAFNQRTGPQVGKDCHARLRSKRSMMCAATALSINLHAQTQSNYCRNPCGSR